MSKLQNGEPWGGTVVIDGWPVALALFWSLELGSWFFPSPAT